MALWNRTAISNGFRDICIQVYLVHDLNLLGSRNAIGHATITPGPICYSCSIVTESVSSAVFEVMGPKHIGVTTVTRNVIDDVTILFVISYR